MLKEAGLRLETAPDAQAALDSVGKGWLFVGVLSAVAGTIFLFFKNGSPLFLADVGLQILAGILLPRSRSRLLAVLLLLYSFLTFGATIGNRLTGASDEGGNVLLAIFVVLIGFRGVWAAFAFHRAARSVVNWMNVAIVLGIYLAESIAVFLLGVLVACGFELAELEVSDNGLGGLMMVLVTAFWGGTYLLVRRRLAWIRPSQAERDACQQP
jgi:hypothetical protein